jgi:hypothetical protein
LICERKQPPTLNQALHLISGDTIQEKISNPHGVLSQMLAEKRQPRGIVEELYLRTFSRYPDAEETATTETAIAKAPNARQGLEDVFWALLNSKEFLYNH